MTQVIRIEITSENGAFLESLVTTFKKSVEEMRDTSGRSINNRVDIRGMNFFDPPV